MNRIPADPWMWSVSLGDGTFRLVFDHVPPGAIPIYDQSVLEAEFRNGFEQARAMSPREHADAAHAEAIALLRRARRIVAAQADSEKLIDGTRYTDYAVLAVGETATDHLLIEIDRFLAP